MISVIIPVYRETEEVMHRLRRITDACRDSQAECIIAAVEGDALPDGLSVLPGISLTCSSAERAAQMNCGAQIARGDMFFFCHADSTPPPDFLRLIDDAVRSGVRTVFVLGGVLVALDLLEATSLVTAVLGSAGVVGIVLGFAFRDMAENYLSGVLLSLRRPFEPGDYVRVDSYEGRVVSLSTRNTVMMTLDGNELRLLMRPSERAAAPK